MLTACSTTVPIAAPTPALATPTAIAGTASPAPTPTALVPQREEPALPEPRQEAASAVALGALWVLGGFDAGRRSTDSVFSLGPGAWIRGPRLPVRIDHASAAELEGVLYYSGGFSDGPAQTALYAYRPPAGWTPLAPMRHPRGAHSLLALAGRLWAVGGNGPAGNEPVIETYDPAANSWSDAALLPLPRNHLAGFVFHGLVCAAGGRAPAVARVDCLDPVAKTWSRLPDLPEPTLGAGAGVIGERVFVAGGEDTAEANLVPKVFTLTGQTWNSEPMLVPRHGFELAALGGRLWACGGATAAGYAASSACTSLA